MCIFQFFLLQEKLERQNMELKNKTSVLQQDLGNSEAVQKDFVRLSQSLQVRQQVNLFGEKRSMFNDFRSFAFRWNWRKFERLTHKYAGKMMTMQMIAGAVNLFSLSPDER